MSHTLPLLEFVNQFYPEASLENTRLICCQHLMESTYKMFCSLKKRGLKFTNISVLGKCYSSNAQIIQEMIEEGIDVSSLSTFFEENTPFDETYKKCVKKFFHASVSKFEISKFERIILLDDGGYLIQEANSFFKEHKKIVGIEQTTSGYQSLKAINLNFPVINIARSDAKLKLESPIIAESAIKQITKKLQKFEIRPKRILILGAGAIGKEIYDTIDPSFDVEMFDVNESLSDFPLSKFERNLKEFDLLIGCTGKISLPKEYHNSLKKNAILASVSSSDREFDAVHLRKQASPDNCHSDLHVNNIILLNAGFPINFWGTRNNIPLSSIQITLALLAAAILEASVMSHKLPRMVSLNPETESSISTKFMKLCPAAVSKKPLPVEQWQIAL